jgi:hypothetical protein
MINQILTGEKVLSEHEKIDISLTDISKGIKQKLKQEFKGCDFSITTQFYSGGCSLHISLMKSDFKVILPFNEISENALMMLESKQYKREQIKTEQEKTHFQLSEYCLNDNYNKDVWNNGVFLTEQGFNLFKRVMELVNKFNWNNSDSNIDYFDVKFYTHLSIGKWNKPYLEEKNSTEQAQAKDKQEVNSLGCGLK